MFVMGGLSGNLASVQVGAVCNGRFYLDNAAGHEACGKVFNLI